MKWLKRRPNHIVALYEEASDMLGQLKALTESVQIASAKTLEAVEDFRLAAESRINDEGEDSNDAN